MPNYTVDKGKWYKDGAQFALKGACWSGGESFPLFPHCWENSYKDMVLKMKNELGLNAIRIAVTKETFLPSERTADGISENQGQINISFADNQEIAGIPPLEAYDIMTDFLAQEEIYFIFDFHTTQKGTLPGFSEFGIWYGRNNMTEQDWIGYMQTLASRFSNNDYFLGLDLCNEPHQGKWDGSQDQSNWRRAAELCGQAVLQTNPNILVFIEGVSDNQAGIQTLIPGGPNVGTNWGSDLRAFRQFPIRENFVPKNKLVLAPHPYGPDVLGIDGLNAAFRDGSFPENMPAVWDGQFGDLSNEDYTFSFTEYAGFMIDKVGSNQRTDADVIFQYRLAEYANDKLLSNGHFFWLITNEGSDTAGIFQDDMSTFNPEVKKFLDVQFAYADAEVGNGGNTGGNGGNNGGGNNNTSPSDSRRSGSYTANTGKINSQII